MGLIFAGAFLAVSSNTRYQIINGLERLVEASPVGKRVPAASLAFTVGVRFANNVYGGMQFVDWARMSGCQWVASFHFCGEVFLLLYMPPLPPTINAVLFSWCSQWIDNIMPIMQMLFIAVTIHRDAVLLLLAVCYLLFHPNSSNFHHGKVKDVV
jgi:hypothetical protein